jgi:DNA ligase D-like protein (predicted polymerase)
MLIRRNTKAFKTIEQIISACKDRADREKLVRLYITKAGHSIAERIPIEGIEGGAGLFYEMTYQAVLNNLKSGGHQLQQSDDVDGIYYFHSSSNKVWDETPFEFDEAVRKEFHTLPELPLFRKKEKVQKFAFPKPKESPGTKPDRPKTRPERGVQPKPSQKEMGPRQPGFKLKHPIHFTDLEKIVFRQPPLTRRDILTYYHDVAAYILPWLKDRPLTLRFRRPDGRKIECSNTDEMLKKNIELPEWLETGKKGEYLLCNDLEHLLFWVEQGCTQFEIGPFRTKTVRSPDYLVIGIESPDADAAKAIEVADVATTILQALKLRGFAKTNGVSGLHMLVPLDGKDDIESAVQVAEYLCRLIRLKVRDKVALEGSGDHEYGKVKLEFSLNQAGNRIVAPYSLFEGESAQVAMPVSRDELTSDLQFENFNPERVRKRLKHSADAWAGFHRKKVGAAAVCKQLEAHYAFLF